MRLPLEVSRLRLEIRDALAQARSSEARLGEAAAQERRELERDLHDGAQQGLLAVGMRLRSLHRRHRDDLVTHDELEAAVVSLEATVTELRRLAHGIRPSRLDDGLPAAVHALVGDSPRADSAVAIDAHRRADFSFPPKGRPLPSRRSCHPESEPAWALAYPLDDFWGGSR